jgi:glutathione S-transferase
MQKVVKEAPKKLKYFSAWFCPFAHRATIALEHHGQKYVNWEWEESLGWENRMPTGDEEFEAGERKDWIYHWKSPELLRVNPRGMIPTLLEESTGKSVTESLVCIEFIDEIALSAGSTASPLLPSDPFERAHLRVMADRMNKKVTSNYYAALVRKDETERKEAFDGILNGLEEFMTTSKGMYYGGDDGLCLVDCVLFPYAWRLYVLEHYRGFRIPNGNDSFSNSSSNINSSKVWSDYHKWLERVESLDYVKRTLPDVDKYLVHVEKYASGRARSKVGNAVRRGKNALEYDDDE